MATLSRISYAADTDQRLTNQIISLWAGPDLSLCQVMLRHHAKVDIGLLIAITSASTGNGFDSRTRQNIDIEIGIRSSPTWYTQYRRKAEGIGCLGATGCKSRSIGLE